jgi:DNA-binding transcriptional LysR family regulator
MLSIRSSVVSRSIASLETDLGETLFDRSIGGARLTPVGRTFLTDALRILSDLERARQSALNTATGSSGRLRLAVCEDATTPLFADVLAAFRRQSPYISLTLFEMPIAAQATALLHGEIDAGLLTPPVHDTGLQVHTMWCDPWTVVLPSDHPLREHDKISVHHLADCNFVSAHPEFGPGCHGQMKSLFDAAGCTPKIVAQAFHRQTMFALVRAGEGVTLAPGSFTDVTASGLEFRPLETDDPGLRVAVVFRSGDLPGVGAQFLRAVDTIFPNGQLRGKCEHGPSVLPIPRSRF